MSAKKKKTKSRVNEAGNYTKPALRKRIFNRIKAGSKGGKPGQWSARKAQMTAAAYKKAGGGYRAKEGGSVGGLKSVPADNKGLKKLPTTVRNKMGYMKKGGPVKK
jgi:hypothetical protein